MALLRQLPDSALVNDYFIYWDMAMTPIVNPRVLGTNKKVSSSNWHPNRTATNSSDDPAGVRGDVELIIVIGHCIFKQLALIAY